MTLTTTKAAQILGLSRTSIYRLVEAGKFDLIRTKAQGKILITQDSFNRFLERHTKKATAYGK